MYKGDLMGTWSLVIILFTYNVGTGASTSIHSIDNFDSEGACNEASDTVLRSIRPLPSTLKVYRSCVNKSR